MIKLVIFDFDGVLVDSNRTWAEVIDQSAKAAGVDMKFTYEDVRPHYGKPYIEVVKAAHPDIVEEGSHVLERMYSSMVDLVSSDGFAESLKAMHGIKSTVRSLKKDYKIAVCSGNPRGMLHRFLKTTMLFDHFDFVIGGDEVDNGKPHPDMLIKALDHFELEPREAVYVGDAKSDIEAAKKAKMFAIAVLSGALNREEAMDLQPDFIVEDATKVKEVLECLS